MIKKMLIAVICSALLMSVTVYAADPFAIKSSIPAAQEYNQSIFSVQTGEILELTPQSLERRMGMQSLELRGITVMQLPDISDGELILEGVAVEQYQFISREELDTLCFVPREAAVAANITVLPQGADSIPTQLSIQVLETINRAPVVEGGSFEIMSNTALTRTVSAYDPDGDTFQLKTSSLPTKGTVSFNGTSFTYEPYSGKTGSDSFTVYAVDRFGNYSEDAKISISIESNRTGFSYVDMHGNPSEYAAVKLHQNGIYSGEKIGSGYFFHPNYTITRAELLVMVLAASGMDSTLSPTVNTGLSNDAELPLWLKPYIKKAIDKGIWNSSSPFKHTEIPSRAEAVQMVARAANITDVKDYNLQMPDITTIPNWAVSSYKQLAAYRMLDLHTGYAYPNRELTTSYSADLIWQLWKHFNR